MTLRLGQCFTTAMSPASVICEQPSRVKCEIKGEPKSTRELLPTFSRSFRVTSSARFVILATQLMPLPVS